MRIAEENGADLKVVLSGIEANEAQREHMVDKIENKLERFRRKDTRYFRIKF